MPDAPAAGATGTGPTQDTRPATQQEITAVVDRILASQGNDARRALGQLADENLAYRRQRKALRQQVEQLTARLPKEGAVVLTGDDAKAWEAYKALGKPEELKKKVDRSAELETKLADRDRQTVIDEAAGAVQYNKDVLGEEIRRRDLHLEMREVTETVNGQTVKKKVPHVRPAKDEKATLEPLTTYAERDMKPYLVALKATGDASASGGGGTNGTSSSSAGAAGGSTGGGSGATWPAQSGTGGGSGGSGNVLDAFLTGKQERDKARSNPLRPAAAATK